MNILFDLVSTQGSVNGGAEYVVRVFLELIQENRNSNNSIIAVYDSSIPFIYNQVSPQVLLDNFNIKSFDLKNERIENIISSCRVDSFFIGIAQRWEAYLPSTLPCTVTIVIHDLVDKETDSDKITYHLIDINFKYLVKKILQNFYSLKSQKLNNKLNRVVEFIKNPRNKVNLIAVSEYSSYSISYYFPEIKREIVVLSSPEKSYLPRGEVQSPDLKLLIESRKKYFLMLSCDRILKNADFAIKVFDVFSKKYPDFYLISVGYKKDKKFDNHIILPYLSTSDLEYAMEHSYALLYPTLFEGFGYPPIEAMKHGKPVLCSNICSIPEVLGDAAVYFSPFYKADLFKALHNIVYSYEDFCLKSKNQYLVVKRKQSSDLKNLINIIFNK